MPDVRLIDANALKGQAVEVEIVTPPHNHYCSELVVFGYDIDEAPTIDAVPVVCARWIHDINNLYGCSACLGRENMSHKKLKRFCPNCGAKMDGDGKR